MSAVMPRPVGACAYDRMSLGEVMLRCGRRHRAAPRSAEDARAVVPHARFHPLGQRGMDLSARSAGWGTAPREQYLRSANEAILVGAMVEGAAAIYRLDDIAAADGLDLLFIGRYDPSHLLGFPGQIDRPEVIEAIETAAATVARHGRELGMYVDDGAAAVRFRRLGVRFIGMSNDADALRRAFSAISSGLADV